MNSKNGSLANERDLTSTPSSSRPKKKRLNLELSPDAYELLQKLSDSSGKNMADVLRTGLALYGIAEQAKDEGRALGVVDGDKVVKEIITT
ncbi:MAG: hypothetical protein AAFQ57_04060 [Cyanobacteria bacterium J06626_14]